MKKIHTVTLLLFTVLLLLTGCSGKPVEHESEPDTDTKTQVRALTSDQKVAYRFHCERPYSGGSFELNLLDANIDSGAEARNWLTAAIGDAPGLLSGWISTDHFKKHTVADKGDWDISSFASKDWKLFLPYEFDDIKSADMELTVARQGEIIRLTLDIDGSRAWYVQQKIGNMGDETAYIYLSISGTNTELSGITFSDMGGAGWLPPWWVRLILRIGVIAAAYFLCRAAKKSAVKHLFYNDKGSTFMIGAWGLTVFLLAALIAMHMGIPISRNLYFLPLPLPGDGIGFWIMAVILGILVLFNAYGIAIMARDNGGIFLGYLFGVSLFSICYLPWCISVLFLFFDLLNVLVNGFAVFLAFGVIALFVVGAAHSGKDNSDNDSGGSDSVTSAPMFADAYRRDGDSEYCYLISSGDNHAVIKDESGNYITIRRHGSGGLVIDDNGNLYRPV